MYHYVGLVVCDFALGTLRVHVVRWRRILFTGSVGFFVYVWACVSSVSSGSLVIVVFLFVIVISVRYVLSILTHYLKCCKILRTF